MISGTDGFGASMRKQCLEVVGEYGIEVVADESYGPTDADMTPQLTNIKNTAGIQAVLNPGFGQGPSIVTRNYQQLAVGLPLYQSHGVASKGFIDLAGASAAEGVRLPGTALLVGRPPRRRRPAEAGGEGLHRRVPGRLRRGRPRPSAATPTTPSRSSPTRSPAPAPPSPRRSATRSRRPPASPAPPASSP